MMIQRRPRGLGVIEVLLSLVLVGMLLGLVAKGYQTVNRLNQASYELSQKLEIAAFIRRLSGELSSARSVTPSAGGLSLTRINPVYNRTYNESFNRLPWPIPGGPADLNAGTIAVTYQLNSAKQITRTLGSDTTVAVEDVGAFSLAVSGQKAELTIQPGNMSAGWKTEVFLPGVTP